MACRLGISSMSLGRCFAGHTFEHRMDVAQKHGYQGIELFFEDLEDVAMHHTDGSSPQANHSSSYPIESSLPRNALLAAAKEVYQICHRRNIEIICLQPFAQYEGLLDRAEHQRHIAKLMLWIDLARELHTDMIQIPSNFLPAHKVTTDLDLIVADLREVADIGLAQNPPFRFVYESLAWGTRVDVWEQCWEVVRRVDRSNFGICLDSFNIAARIYADPAAPDGKTVDAEEAVAQSMARLIRAVDPKKVFYVEVVDAERLSEPLVDGHAFYNKDQPARMSWSRNCRLFYGEQDKGAYLPIRDIAWAFFKGLGFQGWVSLELFNRRMSDTDAQVPEELATRGAASWRKMQRDFGLNQMGDEVPTIATPKMPCQELPSMAVTPRYGMA